MNAWGVRVLARACRDAGEARPLQHRLRLRPRRDRTTPFTEDDAPGPVSVYGLSKLAGEYLVRAEAPDALVIRTCGLYGVWGSGGKGGNFVETMLRLARAGEAAARGERPALHAELHRRRRRRDGRADRAPARRGLFHVTNAGSCTWYEFAAEIFRQAGLKPISRRSPPRSSAPPPAARRTACFRTRNSSLRGGPAAATVAGSAGRVSRRTAQANPPDISPEPTSYFRRFAREDLDVDAPFGGYYLRRNLNKLTRREDRDADAAGHAAGRRVGRGRGGHRPARPGSAGWPNSASARGAASRWCSRVRRACSTSPGASSACAPASARRSSSARCRALMPTLDELRPGERAEVRRGRRRPALVQRLYEFGLLEGETGRSARPRPARRPDRDPPRQHPPEPPQGRSRRHRRAPHSGTAG